VAAFGVVATLPEVDRLAYQVQSAFAPLEADPVQTDQLPEVVGVEEAAF